MIKLKLKSKTPKATRHKNLKRADFCVKYLSIKYCNYESTKPKN